MGLLITSIISGSIATTIYAIMAYKWFCRSQWTLLLFNLGGSIVAAVFTFSYISVLASQYSNPCGLYDLSGIYFPLAPYMLFFPAVARFLELRREERYEALAKRLRQELQSDV